MHEVIELIGRRFPLTQITLDDYADFKVSLMSMNLESYEAKGLGNVSYMQGKAMGGLMKMDALIISPFMRDLPLFSSDYICAMGKHTLLIEYYDTMLDAQGFNPEPLMEVKRSLSMLPDHDLGSHWYDNIRLEASLAKRTGASSAKQLNAALLCAVDSYLVSALTKPLFSYEESKLKRQKCADYVDGLLENGGPSTDSFVKSLGREKVEFLFKKLIFGTDK